MSDKEARALAAGKTVQLSGQEYTISPITIGRLQELQREAVSFYKRQIVSTYAENLDLLGDVGEKLLREKLAEISKYDVDDLPKKLAYDVSNVEITEALQKRLLEEYGEDAVGEEPEWNLFLATALDQERITPAEVKELTGKAPYSARIAYDAWWVTGSYDGMIALVHASLRRNHPKTTKEDIKDWPISDLAAVARQAESLTAPTMGNT